MVCVVDDNAAICVELAHHLERGTGNSSLVVLRLGIHNNLDIALLALCTYLVKSIQHLLWWQFALMKCVDNCSSSSRCPAAVLVRVTVTKGRRTYLIANISPSSIKSIVSTVPALQDSITSSISTPTASSLTSSAAAPGL